MARSNFSIGPNLIRRYGGTYANPVPTNAQDTGVLSYTLSSDNSTNKRVKPKLLLSNLTNYSAMEGKVIRQVVPLSYGNCEPITSFLAFQNSLTTVSAQVAKADQRAVNALRASIKDMQWDAAVTAAELGKTLAFIIDIAGDIRHAWRSARRGDIFGLSELYHKRDRKGRRKKPRWQELANPWLQWRYAVRPLVADLDDMLHELARSNIKPAVMRADGRATEWVDKVLVNEPYFTGTVNASHAFVRRNGTVKVHYGMYYTQTQTASFTRLGLTNLASVLWEVTPYSFVIDNFIPIGKYVAGLDAGFGTTFLSGYRVERHDWGEFAHLRGAIGSATVKSYSRSLISSIPNQPLPGWQVPKGDLPSKVLDALALLSQVVKGGGRGR